MSFPTREKPGANARVAYEQEPGNPDVTRRSHNLKNLYVINLVRILSCYIWIPRRSLRLVRMFCILLRLSFFGNDTRKENTTMNTKTGRFLWNLQICARLMQRDLFVFKSMFVRRLINSMVWTALIVYMYEYIGFGSYVGAGLFIACGECAQWGFTGIFGNLLRFLSDMKGPKTISYHLTLPIPQWMVLVTFCLSTSVQLMLVGASILPVSYLIMWGRFPLETISFLKVFCIFFSAYLFYGVLALLYVSFIDSMDQLHVIRVRVRDMLFWMGAYFFTWQRLYEVNHIVAYLDLLNPLVYAAEGMRAAVMGQEGSLPFWWCCAALFGFTFVAGIVAVRRMLKKLDCVY